MVSKTQNPLFFYFFILTFSLLGVWGEKTHPPPKHMYGWRCKKIVGFGFLWPFLSCSTLNIHCFQCCTFKASYNLLRCCPSGCFYHKLVDKFRNRKPITILPVHPMGAQVIRYVYGCHPYIFRFTYWPHQSKTTNSVIFSFN